MGKRPSVRVWHRILHTEQRGGLIRWLGIPRKWYSAISEQAGQLPELNVQYSRSSAAILSLGSGPGHMCKPLVCVRGHGCGWMQTQLVWGNSPPSAPPEGSQAWSQQGGCPEGLWSPLFVSALGQYKSRFTNFEPVLYSDFFFFLGDSNIWILSVHFMYLFCIC